jgi:ferric-dicitrate binding protein FerR (iron transport regulator)
MSHEHDAVRPADAEMDVGQLMKLAGRRPAPDAARMAHARAAAHAEWARLVRRRRRAWTLRVFGASTVAACLVGLAAWSWFRTTPASVSGPEVATLRTSVGATVTVVSADGRSTALQAGARLRAGDRIEVPAAARAALTLSAGLSVRLDERTTATIESTGRLTMARGAVYVDAGDSAAGEAFVVRTPLGDVRHVGTQFEVRLRAGDLHVRVRQGAVIVERGGRSWSAGAGEGLLVGVEGLRGRVGAEPSGPQWAWVTLVAEPFQLEGATMPAFLDWVSREQGWRWEYERPSRQRSIERIVLHGSADGLTPQEALEAVLATSGLTYKLRGGILVISD